MVEDVELIIVVNSERFIEKRSLRGASENWVKMRKLDVEFREERILLDIVFWNLRTMKCKKNLKYSFRLICKFKISP